MKTTLILFLISGVAQFYCAQANYDLHLSVNTNTYFPLNREKGIFPAIGYDKDGEPKLLIGGFGVGLMGRSKLMMKLKRKAMASLLSKCV
jgi:hypothetical protein